MGRPHSGTILGNLERQIMEIVWGSDNSMSVAEVMNSIVQKRSIAYTTVMTIMTRLVQKRVLTRSLNGSKYLYKARISKNQFAANAIHNIFTNTISALGDEVVVHFMKEIQKLNPKKRQELAKLLETNE